MSRLGTARLINGITRLNRWEMGNFIWIIVLVNNGGFYYGREKTFITWIFTMLAIMASGNPGRFRGGTSTGHRYRFGGNDDRGN